MFMSNWLLMFPRTATDRIDAKFALKMQNVILYFTLKIQNVIRYYIRSYEVANLLSIVFIENQWKSPRSMNIGCKKVIVRYLIDDTVLLTSWPSKINLALHKTIEYHMTNGGEHKVYGTPVIVQKPMHPESF